MYKYIKSSDDVEVNVIDITMFFDYESEDEDIESTRCINHGSIPKKDRLSEDQLIFYDDFIDTVRSIVLSHFDKILSGKQSHGSYSYYINVDTGVDTNDPKTTWQFRLRASNHVNPNQRNLDDNNIGNSTGLIFRSIVVGKDRKSFKSYHQALMAIDSICRDLASGDLSSIARQFKNVNYTQEEYDNLIESLEDIEEYEISEEDKVERNRRRKDLYDRSPDDTD